MPEFFARIVAGIDTVSNYATRFNDGGLAYAQERIRLGLEGMDSDRNLDIGLER